MPHKINDAERELFQKAMKDVTPLKHGTKKISKKNLQPITPQKRLSTTQSTTNFIPLSDAFQTPVSPESTLQFSKITLPRAQYRRFKNGDFRPEATLDLHGMNREQASQRLIAFIQAQIQKGVRVFLLIHGKGSRDGGLPIMKNLTNHWLTQIPEVLAFQSAQPKDGGNGAVYVLLKRIRKS